MLLREVNQSIESRVIDDIIKIIDGINDAYKKDEWGSDIKIFGEVTVFTGHTGEVTMNIVTNAEAGRVADHVQLLEEELEDAGIIGGVLPVNVTIGEAAFDDNKIVIRVWKIK